MSAATDDEVWWKTSIVELSELLGEALAIEEQRDDGDANDSVREAFTYAWRMRWESGALPSSTLRREK